MVWAAIARAVLPSLVGAYEARKQRKAAAQPQVVKNDYDFRRLRREALKAGFNPLTVVGHGGTGTRSTSPIPQLSSQGYVLQALAGGLSEYINHIRLDGELERANSQGYVAGSGQSRTVSASGRGAGAGNARLYAGSARGQLVPASDDPLGGFIGNTQGVQFEPVLREPRRGVSSTLEVRSGVADGVVGIIPNEEAMVDIGDLAGTTFTNPQYIDAVVSDVDPYSLSRLATYPLSIMSKGAHAWADTLENGVPRTSRLGRFIQWRGQYWPYRDPAPEPVPILIEGGRPQAPNRGTYQVNRERLGIYSDRYRGNTVAESYGW